MNLNELVLYYKAERGKVKREYRRTPENHFIMYVHEAYEFYKRIDDSTNVSIESILGNLDVLITKFREKLRLGLARDYMYLMRTSLTEAPLKDVLSDEVRELALLKMEKALEIVDQQMNDVHDIARKLHNTSNEDITSQSGKISQIVEVAASNTQETEQSKAVPNDNLGYIYLLREREFKMRGDNVYKVGRTIQGRCSLQLRRLNDYKKGSELCFVRQVNNIKVVEIETTIKAEFRKVFKRHADGHEYFYGDMEHMIDIINTVCVLQRNE